MSDIIRKLQPAHLTAAGKKRVRDLAAQHGADPTQVNPNTGIPFWQEVLARDQANLRLYVQPQYLESLHSSGVRAAQAQDDGLPDPFAGMPAQPQRKPTPRPGAVSGVGLSNFGADLPEQPAPQAQNGYVPGGTMAQANPYLSGGQSQEATLRDSPAPIRAQQPAGLPNIPGFTLEKLLGQGAMGAVFSAVDDNLGRRCAVKVMLTPPDSATVDPEALRLFLRERRVHSRLEHQNIGQIYTGGSYKDPRVETELPFYAMKQVPGRNLEDAIRDELIDFNQRERVLAVAKAAEAVAYAHDKNVIHRDLKPENIMIGADGVFVMDFGLAKPTEDLEKSIEDAVEAEQGSDIDVSVAGSIKGTPMYMSPEQTHGVTCKEADVYALGAILFESLARERFRSGQYNGIYDLVQDIRNNPGGSADGYSKIPKELASIIKASTAQDVHSRPSAQTFTDNLYSWLNGDPVELHTYSFFDRAKIFMSEHGGKLVAATTLAASLAGGAALVTSSQLSAARSEKSEAQARAEAAAARAETAEALERARTAAREVYKTELDQAIAQSQWQRADTLLSRLVGSGFSNETAITRYRSTIDGLTEVTIDAPSTVQYRIAPFRGATEENTLSLTGDQSIQLAPGTYKIEGPDDYLDFFRVQRGQTVDETIDPAPAQINGFVWIPSGPSTTNGVIHPRQVDVESFYAAQRQVTWRDYLAFLNSEEFNNRVLSQDFMRDNGVNHLSRQMIASCVPMIPDSSAPRGYRPITYANRDDLQRFGVTEDHPVYAISAFGAEAYLSWLRMKNWVAPNVPAPEGVRVDQRLMTEEQYRLIDGVHQTPEGLEYLTRFAWGNEVDSNYVLEPEEAFRQRDGEVLLRVSGDDRAKENLRGMTITNVGELLRARGYHQGVGGIRTSAFGMHRLREMSIIPQPLTHQRIYGLRVALNVDRTH